MMGRHGWRAAGSLAVAMLGLAVALLRLPIAAAAAEDAPLPFGVWWFAPFFSGGGYSSEAIGFVQSLVSTNPDAANKVDLHLTQHGDAFNRDWFDGLDRSTRQLMFDLSSEDPKAHDERRAATVVICHSEPGAWALPQALYSTTPCPAPSPPHKPPALLIGRTTFETDRLAAGHVERCNKMDEVWVPSTFNRDTFIASGVQASKLRVVHEPVDVAAFDPAATEALELPIGSAVKPRTRGLRLTSAAAEGGGRALIMGSTKKESAAPDFAFLSVFKWEMRKGWDILMKAYLEEFSAEDDVSLYLLTNAYHTKRAFKRQIRKLAEQLDATRVAEGLPTKQKTWPRVYLVEQHVPNTELPGLYKAMDAFVLPSRGEGWGRPHVEAMAMGLPIIATNWSGPTEYMTDLNSFPLKYDGLSEIADGAFVGHKWADPSLSHLRELMRYVQTHDSEAAEKGLRARQDMVERFSPSAIGAVLMSEFRRIAGKIDPARSAANKQRDEL